MRFFVILLTVLFCLNLNAQNRHHLFGIGALGSIVDFSSPAEDKLFQFSDITYNGGATIGLYLNSSLDLHFDGTFGKVRIPTNEVGEYQEEQFVDVAAQLDYKFNNGYIFSEEAVFSPFLFTGIGFNNLKDEIAPYLPFGLGFNLYAAEWLTFRLQSGYKWSFVEDNPDYQQHTLGVIFCMGGGKGKSSSPDPIVQNDDADSDGIMDADDECPLAFGTAEFNGCPDTDGDGLGDSRDKCPFDAGAAENNGCPEADTDGDGIADVSDECPTEKGTPAFNGCPDRDSDGIADKDDKCPDQFGVLENDGCPKKDPVIVPAEMEAGDMIKSFSIFFTDNSTIIRNDQMEELETARDFLKSNPELSVEIKGHTDSDGDREANIELSTERANSVWEYLYLDEGLRNDMMIYGFGEFMPRYDNDDTDEKPKNRRVDIEVYK